MHAIYETNFVSCQVSYIDMRVRAYVSYFVLECAHGAGGGGAVAGGLER